MYYKLKGPAMTVELKKIYLKKNLNTKNTNFRICLVHVTPTVPMASLK